MTSTSITSAGKGCEKMMCVYRSISIKTVFAIALSRSLERLFNTCSNTKHIKHRQFNRNNYYHFVNKIHSNKLSFSGIELCAASARQTSQCDASA